MQDVSDFFYHLFSKDVGRKQHHSVLISLSSKWHRTSLSGVAAENWSLHQFHFFFSIVFFQAIFQLTASMIFFQPSLLLWFFYSNFELPCCVCTEGSELQTVA